MLPHTHFKVGLVFGLLGMYLNIISGIQAAALSAVAVLVDLDHYIRYLMLERNANFLNFWNASSRRSDTTFRTIIHRWWGMAFITPVLALVYYYSRSWGYVLLAGYLSHVLTDQVSLGKEAIRRYRLGSLVIRTSFYEIGFDVLLVLVIAYLGYLVV